MLISLIIDIALRAPRFRRYAACCHFRHARQMPQAAAMFSLPLAAAIDDAFRQLLFTALAATCHIITITIAIDFIAIAFAMIIAIDTITLSPFSPFSPPG